MRQDVTADAAVMGRELKAAGKTIIYGIYFGTGSAVIKPESEPALAEMVKLLKGTPTLKAFIVGHTDNVGTLETNQGVAGVHVSHIPPWLKGGAAIESVGPLPFPSSLCNIGQPHDRV